MLYLVAILCTLVLLYYYDLFNYWTKRQLVSYPSRNIFSGSLESKNLLKENIKFYNYFKSKGSIHGGFLFFHTPVYMPVSRELLKQILSKDFDVFHSKGLYSNHRHQKIAENLFLVSGARWRDLRNKLSTTFTSGKLKSVTPLIVECTKNMLEFIQNCYDCQEPFDGRVMAGKFTTDVIGTCAYGIECNSFKDPNCEFKSHADQITLCPLRFKLIAFLGLNFPNLLEFFKINLIPKSVEEFYSRITRDTVRYRRDNQIKRNDLFQVLLDMHNKMDSLTMDELIAQTFMFFIAGYETSSATITFTLFELAYNAEIQERLRKEINEVVDGKYDGQITYDAVNDMTYMTQVIDETLRKYPPVNLNNRQCSKEYQVPNTNVVLSKGTKVFIPIYAIQHDPDYFPDPELYNPDRFSLENKKNIKSFTYMPFGEGPRYCIGARFGVMTIKIALCTLLRKFRFHLDDGVPYPPTMGPTFVSLAPEQKLMFRTTSL